MALDNYTRSYFELRLKHVFADQHADQFQGFFTRLMTLRYAGDFVATVPWGSSGDMKNDGYLVSERKLFAVYAPRALKMAPTKAKAKSDYEGAVQHWSEFFDEWIFVHNTIEGLPAPLLKHLLTLQKKMEEACQGVGLLHDSCSRVSTV